MQGASQASAYRTQAAIAERQARVEQQQGNYEATRSRQSADRRLAGIRGQYLSSGFALSGSTLGILEDSAREASLDEQAIRYGAQMRADNARFEASQARSNAGSAMVGGALGAITPFIGAVSQQRQQNRLATMIRNPYVSYGAAA